MKARRRTSAAHSTLCAFTLIELLIVVIIVGILAAAAVPLYMSQANRAKTVEAISGLGAVCGRETEYKAETGSFLAVAAGDIGNEPKNDSNPGLGLDFSGNTYFDINSFSVVLDATHGYIAKCDGGADDNAAPRSADVADIVCEMRGKGRQARYSYDAGTTYTDWE